MPAKTSRLKPAPLVPDGEAWSQVARQVKPLPRSAGTGPVPLLPPLPKVFAPQAPGEAAWRRAEQIRRTALPGHVERPLPQMDARLQQKLRQGRLPVEQRLDLHGLTLPAAERALDAFLRQAVAHQHRGLLIITGKGNNSQPGAEIHERRGVLRSWLPEYLRRGPWRDTVLGLAPARRELGGSGAFFVLLRRQRYD